jgi:hypothetical protein
MEERQPPFFDKSKTSTETTSNIYFFKLAILDPASTEFDIA